MSKPNIEYVDILEGNSFNIGCTYTFQSTPKKGGMKPARATGIVFIFDDKPSSCGWIAEEDHMTSGKLYEIKPNVTDYSEEQPITTDDLYLDRQYYYHGYFGTGNVTVKYIAIVIIGKFNLLRLLNNGSKNAHSLFKVTNMGLTIEDLERFKTMLEKLNTRVLHHKLTTTYKPSNLYETTPDPTTGETMVTINNLPPIQFELSSYNGYKIEIVDYIYQPPLNKVTKNIKTINDLLTVIEYVSELHKQEENVSKRIIDEQKKNSKDSRYLQYLNNALKLLHSYIAEYSTKSINNRLLKYVSESGKMYMPLLTNLDEDKGHDASYILQEEKDKLEKKIEKLKRSSTNAGGKRRNTRRRKRRKIKSKRRKSHRYRSRKSRR